MCSVSATEWRGMLDTTQTSPQADEHLPPLLYPHYARHHQQAAVGAAHPLSKHPGAVGRCGDNHSEAHEVTPGVARILG